jgi:YSIRK-targeted surface antigen transcriptional regulator
MINVENSQTVLEDIEYLCKLIFNTIKIPIHFLNDNCDIIYSYAPNCITNPLPVDRKDFFSKLFPNMRNHKLPTIASTNYYENYLGVTFYNKESFIGTFIAGPSAFSYIQAETINDLMSNYKISLSYKNELIKYFNALTIIEYNDLVNTCVLLYYLIYNEKLSPDIVIKYDTHLEDANVKVKLEYENIMIKNRQNSIFHHSYAEEKKIFQCIKEGNKEKLLQNHLRPKDGESGILSRNNPLRAEKNLAICCVTLATRAAIEGGLDSELAYSMSDSYIKYIEDIDTIKGVNTLSTELLCDFADKVSESRQQKYSKAIFSCKNYIIKHLYEDISLWDLSKHTNLSMNYLSELFRKEVGVPISQYIQRERIEEAKKLLISSNYSLLDISAWLQFYDQSHFTRLFKKYTGVSPKKYRNNNFINS